MTKELTVPVSAGELIDKITILQIKSERIQDPIKLENVVKELNLLEQVWKESTYSTYDISQEKDALYEVNSILWEIEDSIRDKERQKTFDSEFIDLARKVYRTNDLRANIKKTINDNLGSNLSEEKSYQPY